MPRPPRTNPPDRSAEFEVQTRLSVYGFGPYEPELGHPVGCQDVADLVLRTGFVVVRSEALEAKKTRIAELEVALLQAHLLCVKALPKFDWRASALDADAIAILNTAPAAIARALGKEGL